MEWIMLNESKKLFPHWLDKSNDSNFSKHLNILNHQQRDIRHKIKTVDWSRLLNKPLQIHKTQTEPHKWKMEFEVDVPRLKKVNIYKNPTIVNNQVVNSYDVVEGYYDKGEFYSNHNKEITNLLKEEVSDEIETYFETDIEVSDKYSEKIDGKEGKYYLDLNSKKYYEYLNGSFSEVSEDDVPQTSLIHSESFIDNYSHFFRHILYEDNSNSVNIYKIILDEDNNPKYKTILDYSETGNIEDKGKYELISSENNADELYYDVNTQKYCICRNDKLIKPKLVQGLFQDTGIIGDSNENGFSYNTKTTIVTSDSEGTLVYNSDTVSGRVYSAIMPNGTYDDWEYPIKAEFDIIYGDDNVRVQLFKNNSLSISRTLAQLGNPSHIKIEYDGETARYYVDDNPSPVYTRTFSIGNNFQIRFSVPIQSSIKYKNFIIYKDIEEQEDYDDSIEYIIFKDSGGNSNVSRIPLIESEDITPLISNDKYVLEVYTWNDYHFLKGFPEIDFIDYNNNNIIDVDERTYDNLNIEIETINEIDYLTFRVHQYGIKLVEVFKDEKPIHTADFIIEKFGYTDKQINDNFAHIYNYNDNQVYYLFEKDTNSIEEANFDVDEYVWRLKLSEDDKIYDENGNFELKNNYDLKVTYYDSSNPYDSTLDKILTKRYVCEDSIFYHDMSLDMLGSFWNVPRHVFIQQSSFESYNDQIEYYSKTYPTYSNTLTEDDYHYQKRLEYYISNYNKIYFPVLELWKFFHINSELINRKVIIAEQDYSYLRCLDKDDDKYINELGLNKIESTYLDYDFVEEKNLKKPKHKSIISPNDYLNSENGILIDANGNKIRDVNTNIPVRIDYVYSVDDEEKYTIEFENASKKIQWYESEFINEKSIYQLKLTDTLKVVPNTRYQLRFCVKEYPNSKLKLKKIYKNNKGEIREVEEDIPLRKDYDAIEECKNNNEIIYNNYDSEWGVSCEYICTDFLTLSTAQNIELCLESEDSFRISDITLQRITINHLDTEYIKTSTDYNSCVYDLYANYNEIPSNIKFDNWNVFGRILNRSLPLTKTGYFNFALTNMSNNMKLIAETNVYIENMLSVESSAFKYDAYSNIKEHTYNFKRYVKKGEYEIILEPFDSNLDIIYDFNIDIEMFVFTETNSVKSEKMTITDLIKYQKTYENGKKYFSIPFMNESDYSFNIKIYRSKNFSFKNFKLIRKLPLKMEELSK